MKVNDRLRKSRAKIQELKEKLSDQASLSWDYKQKFLEAEKDLQKLANQVTLGGEQKNKEISELALQVAELIKEAKAEKAKANVAKTNAEKAKANAQKKVKGKNAGSQTNATETNSWNETRAKQEFNKLNNQQSLYSEIKKLNEKVQLSFIKRIPKANTPAKIQEIRNQIREALKNKQKANRPIPTNPLYAQTNAAGANAAGANAAGANAAGANTAGANNKKLEKKRQEVRNKAKSPGYVPGIGIGLWGRAIKTANMTRLKELDKELNNRKAFSNEIKKMNNIGMKEKGGYLKNIWKYNKTINIVKEAIEANEKALGLERLAKERRKQLARNIKEGVPGKFPGAMERRQQLAKNKIIQDFKQKQQQAKNTVGKLPLKNNNKTALLRKLNEITANNNKITQNTPVREIQNRKEIQRKEIQTIIKSAQTKSANFIREKAAREKNEKAKKKEAEKKAAQEAKAAKEKANAEKKAAQEKANAEQKAAKEKANSNAAEKAKKTKSMARSINRNKRLNQGTKNQLLKRLKNGNNLNKVSAARNNAVQTRTTAAVKIQAAERGRQAREKLAKKKANNALKVHINKARGVIETSYSKLSNNNKKGFMTQLNKAKNRTNVKRIQESAMMIHRKAVAENKEIQRQEEKKRKENAARAKEAEQRKKQQLARQQKANRLRREEEAKKAKQNERNRKVAAATKIQAGFRGMRNRKAVAVKRKAKKKQQRELKLLRTNRINTKPANPLGRR